MLFVGTYEHSIDAKQRLAIPSDIRVRLSKAGQDDALYAVVQEGPTLCLYTENGFEKRSEQLDQAERSAAEVLQYEQMFFSLAQRLEIDKQGRVRLPERLIEMTGLSKQVVVIGVKDHLEIHNRKAWADTMRQLLADKPGLLMNPRRVMQAETND